VESNSNIPVVSVIVNCFNGEKFLKKAIQSILDQTYQNFEIIFWDNKSTDNSAKIIKSYNDDRIKYYYANDFTKLYASIMFLTNLCLITSLPSKYIISIPSIDCRIKFASFKPDFAVFGRSI